MNFHVYFEIYLIKACKHRMTLCSYEDVACQNVFVQNAFCLTILVYIGKYSLIGEGTDTAKKYP